MQQSLFVEYRDYSKQKVMIGLSGGINSMAVLCWLASYPKEFLPKELHIFYAHFDEHSPDTMDFVLDGINYAKQNFEIVRHKITQNSVLAFFEEQKMIPHPMVAPCTRMLKIEPMMMYMVQNRILVDLVGYVRNEQRRIKNMAEKSDSELIDNVVNIKGLEKHFPISDQTNEWCFQIVKKEIGWYPKIYDIKDRKGKRVFHHNNCLPCKNMNPKDLALVKKHYPEMWENAMLLSEKLSAYWGRNETEFYTTFGRENVKDGQTCSVCKFD